MLMKVRAYHGGLAVEVLPSLGGAMGRKLKTSEAALAKESTSLQQSFPIHLLVCRSPRLGAPALPPKPLQAAHTHEPSRFLVVADVFAGCQQFRPGRC